MKKIPYHVTPNDVARAGNAHLQTHGYRPDWHTCCALALVDVTWRWRALVLPLDNAARLKKWYDTRRANVDEFHHAITDPRERAHFTRIQRGDYQ